jgi:hypothetical protein
VPSGREFVLNALGLRLMMELIAGLKASIRERKDETTPRQAVIPENNALCTPSMVASLLSKVQRRYSRQWQQKGAGQCSPSPTKSASCCQLNTRQKQDGEGRNSLSHTPAIVYRVLSPSDKLNIHYGLFAVVKGELGKSRAQRKSLKLVM